MLEAALQESVLYEWSNREKRFSKFKLQLMRSLYDPPFFLNHSAGRKFSGFLNFSLNAKN